MNENEILKLCRQFDGVVLEEYPNYIVCRNGEVYSLARNRFLDKTRRKRNPLDINSKSDDIVHLSLADTSISIAVYRLLAKAFVPNPENKKTVNHIDGNPSNISIENLEWMTQSENSIHAHENNLVGGKYTRCTKSRIVYNEELIGVYSSTVKAIKDLNLKSTNANVRKAAILNVNVPVNTEKVPFTSQGIVWRYVVEDEKACTTVPVKFAEFDINKIEHLKIRGYDDYVVTVDGRIYNTRTAKWLTTTLITPKGRSKYAVCSLKLPNSSYKMVRLARIVADAFCGNWKNVGHVDGNILNCAASNLVEVNCSHTERKIAAYRLQWKEVVIEEYESVDAICKDGMSKCAVLDVIIKNKVIPIGVNYSTDKLPYTYKEHVLRGWK